jgi:uncharacterized protein YbjT (DUF2867 family)
VTPSGTGVHVVVGASGCVGARLVRRLAARGERVRVLVRREGLELPANVETVHGDLLRPSTLRGLGRDATAFYYLAHAMGEQPHGSGDLEALDRAQAHHALEAVRSESRPHAVYVSGLGASPSAPSAHLRGRWAVEDEIQKSGLGFTIFRAGVLLGPGSVGFELLVRSVRQTVVPLPKWTEIVMQPFALSDLLDALERAPRDPRFRGRVVSLGTSDRTTYAEYFRRAAKAMGFDPVFVAVPGSLQAVASLAMARQARIPSSEADALAESLVSTPFLVEDDGRGMRELEIPVRPLEEALRIGLRDAVAERAAC